MGARVPGEQRLTSCAALVAVWMHAQRPRAMSTPRVQSARRPAVAAAAAAAAASTYDDSSDDEHDEESDAAAAAALDAQLDAELLALRSMRDEEVGIRPGEFDTAGDDSDDDSGHSSSPAASSGAAAAAAAATATATGSVRDDSSDEEDEEFQQLLHYKPRCTFRAGEGSTRDTHFLVAWQTLRGSSEHRFTRSVAV